MLLQRSQHVLGTTTLCKLAVAMEANHLDSTLQIGFVGHERLTEVILLARLLQNLRLKERQGTVVPARAASVLVLDAANGILLNRGEHRFILVGRVFLFFCLRAQSNECQQRKCH